MSKNFSAAQFERTFAAQRLGNWEIADTAKLESATLRNRFDQTAPRTSATKFIAGDNGYLHPHHKKAGVTAFTTTDAVQRPVYAVSKPRWPETNVSWPLARRATMGYKGIQGQYLPSGTVPMQTYQTPGAKDFNFHY